MGQELNLYKFLKLKIPKDVAFLKSLIKKGCLLNLLARLDLEFNQINVQILNKEEIPSHCFEQKRAKEVLWLNYKL